jgi:hypothetical protein
VTDISLVKKRTAGPVRLRVRGLRRFLTRNEIFFKTIVATLVTAILSGAAIYIAAQQKGIAEIQRQIAEAQALPSFEIKVSKQRNDQTGFYETSELTIDNNGGAVREFRADVVYFLDLTAIEEKKASTFASAPAHSHQRLLFRNEYDRRHQGALGADLDPRQQSCYIQSHQGLL